VHRFQDSLVADSPAAQLALDHVGALNAEALAQVRIFSGGVQKM
jgi:hypothetical protein